jgi:hypothetical protein
MTSFKVELFVIIGLIAASLVLANMLEDTGLATLIR